MTLFTQAMNRAGLSSATVTAVIIPDRSGPTGGHVLDGDWQIIVEILLNVLKIFFGI